jgi:hypothetical protein
MVNSASPPPTHRLPIQARLSPAKLFELARRRSLGETPFHRGFWNLNTHILILFCSDSRDLLPRLRMGLLSSSRMLSGDRAVSGV